MANQEAIYQIQESIVPQLMAQPGVTGVGVGLREKNGDLTDEIVIRIYVEHKRPADEVPPALRIPKEIQGVKTDVIEKGPDVVLSLKNYHQRPIVSGLEISRVFSSGDQWRGTIGCFVHDKLTKDEISARNNGATLSRQIHLLSASHVLNPTQSTVDTLVYQPRPVGYINRVAETTKSRCIYSGAIDAGLALLDRDTAWKNDVHDVGTIEATRKVRVGETVWKQGVTTGLTSARVIDNSYFGNFPDTNRIFGPGMLILHNLLRDPFANAGDSGALIFVREDGPDGRQRILGVGLLAFAGGSSVTACHLETVFEQLNVDLAPGRGNRGQILLPVVGSQGVSA